jgi:hypothetical protein
MASLYKFFKNYTLPLAAVLLVVSLVGLAIGFHLLTFVSASLDAQLAGPLRGGWDQMVAFLAALGALVGGWYVAEQAYNRRRFEKLMATDKRSEFADSRKDLEDLARRLPDRYKPRIAEKESQFKSSRRA